MLAVLINFGAIILGSLLGLAFGKLLNEKLTRAAMTGIGLCTLYIGFSGALKGQSPVITILALVFGAVLGTLLDIEGFIQRLGQRLDRF